MDVDALLPKKGQGGGAESSSSPCRREGSRGTLAPLRPPSLGPRPNLKEGGEALTRGLAEPAPLGPPRRPRRPIPASPRPGRRPLPGPRPRPAPVPAHAPPRCTPGATHAPRSTRTTRGARESRDPWPARHQGRAAAAESSPEPSVAGRRPLYTRPRPPAPAWRRYTEFGLLHDDFLRDFETHWVFSSTMK